MSARLWTHVSGAADGEHDRARLAGGAGDEMAGADIAQHLARYGLDVEVQRIISRELDVANAILSHAVDSSADFMIMGGYGHSRLREFILGGATRGVLTAMTVPTLLSH